MFLLNVTAPIDNIMHVKEDSEPYLYGNIKY